MRTGRLIISRGHQLGEPPPPPRPAAVPVEPTKPALPLYPEIGERLTALERLARLFEQGALSPQEFAFEKALILGRFGDEATLTGIAPASFVPAQPRQRRPSLIGRLLSWKLLPVGLASGLAFSFASQPRETMAFFDDLLRLVGV